MERPAQPPLPRTLAAFAILLAAPLASAQQTLVVGAGQAFSTIQSAIDAAAPGDTVLVTAGTYPEVLDIDKGIRLRGQNALLPYLALLSSIEVHDLPATETFAMSGFTATGASTTSTALTVAAHDCAGPVLLHDLAQGALVRWSVVATNCRSVHVDQVAMFAVRNIDSTTIVEGCTFDVPAFTGVIVESGVLMLVDCQVSGGVGISGSGAWVLGGVLVATRGQIRGTTTGPFASPAIACNGGEVWLDPSTVLLPGQGAAPVSGTTPTIAPFASLKTTDAGTALTVQAHGPAGLPFATLLSTPAPALPTPFGITWLDPATALVLQIDAFDANTRLATTTVPHPPLPAGTTLTLQSLVFDGGELRLGVPSVATMP